MGEYAFGVDVGGTAIKIGFFASAGDLLDSWKITTRTENEGKYILSDITNEIENKIRMMNISKLNIKGIGIGIPGPVGQDGTVYKCVNLGWGVFNVEHELEQLIDLGVKAGNDANLAALGEMWKGGGKGYQSIVMVTLGTGIGGGIIINGRIFPGVNGAAGEIGHLHVKDDEKKCCGCGKKGCLEQYSSATGIVHMTHEYFAEHDNVKSILREFDFNAKDIFEAAKSKDTTALAMVEEAGRMLGKGLAQIACIVNPEAFVIGGGMSKAGDLLLDNIRKHFITYAFHSAKNTNFCMAQLGNTAGIIGAAKLVLADGGNNLSLAR